MRMRIATLLAAAGACSSICAAGASGVAAAAPAVPGTAGAPPVATGAPAPVPASGPPATGPTPSRQLIVVSARAYGETRATLSAYSVAGRRRHLVLGPFSAQIGYGGFAPPARKREGDGRTPSGTYRFSFMFGLDANPGVRYAYRAIHPYDVWDDDPSSPLYNRWVDELTHDPGVAPEPMDQAPAYDYGAVIAYNTAHTPGLGSAIFLHVGSRGSTAGCVSLPVGELLEVLRWLDPARSPRIRMGVGANAAN